MSIHSIKLIYFKFLLGLQLFSPQICLASHTSIRIDNGYKGVVISISTEITVETQVIDEIKTLISDASKALFDATDGRIYFEEVTLLVLNMWPNTTPSDVPSIRYNDADLIIDNSNSQSYTMQFAGCGQQALPIVISKQIVLAQEPSVLGYRARLLVHEWAHYRYGVFNEFGFPSDPIYPLYYSIPGNPDTNDIRVNSCTDDQRVFNIITNSENGLNCELTTNGSTGKPVSDSCTPLPDIYNNTFESSLMYSESVVNVSKFCGSPTGRERHKHNFDSPNKHNTLCDENDVWSVIERHPDINGQTSRSQLNETKFKIYNIYENSIIRVLFAIDNSVYDLASNETVYNSNRANIINSALNKFMKADSPKSELALFTFKSDSVIDYYDWDHADVQNFKITYSGTPQAIDLEKILTKGTELLTGERGGIYVVLIGSKGIAASNSEEKIEPIAKKLREMNVKLYIIVFPIIESIDDRKHASQLFSRVISITDGQVFNIRKDKSSWLTYMNQMLNALRIIQANVNFDNSKAYHLLDEKGFSKLDTNVSFEFTIDSAVLNMEFRVYFVLPETKFNNMFSSIQIDSRILDKPNMSGENVLGFSFIIDSSTQLGRWTLSGAVRPEWLNQSVMAIAEFRSATALDKTSIQAKCWLNSAVEYNPNSVQPLIGYVNVRQGFDGLISQAFIKLIITDENGTIDTIEMLDNGLGDPDITKGDGIYSQYIVSTRNAGYYTISAVITDTNATVLVTKDFGSTSLPAVPNGKSCCGSQIEGQIEILSGNFKRIVECGSIFVTENMANVEKYPPNSVRDLRIEDISYDIRSVNLLWTSPGGDYTFGNIGRYEIKAFRGADNDPELRHRIKNEFDSIPGADANIITDSPADSYGKLQRSQISIISREEGIYYFALKAYDSGGHASVVSNIVMAYIKDGDIVGDNNRSLSLWKILSITFGCVFIFAILLCLITNKSRNLIKNILNNRVDVIPYESSENPSTKTSRIYDFNIVGNKERINNIYLEQGTNQIQAYANGRFKIIEFINRGSFGRVYKVEDRNDKMLYALKTIEIMEGDKEAFIILAREIEILNKLNNEYVVEYINSFTEKDREFCVIMEYCQFDLKTIIELKKSVCENSFEVRMHEIEFFISTELFREIVECVRYLHECKPPILHRDLKPSNILYKVNSTNGRFLKLCDFGLAKRFDEIGTSSKHSAVGTPKYRAPEVNNHYPNYTTKADIYSIGVIAFDLFENVNHFYR